MKKIKCFLLPFLVICALMFSFKISIIPTYAEETKPTTENNSNTNQEDTTGCNSYTTQEERDQCVKDRAANLSTAPFYSTAIMSIDSKISAKELSQDYIKNFSNSSVTALSYNLSLFDPDTIIMHIVNIVISLIEMIGQAISLVVLILYNVASGSFWKTIIQGVFDIFDKAIFNWGNPNSWFIKILFLFGSLSVAMKLMSQWNKHFTINTLITVTVQVVVSCMMIVFIAQYGRGIISYIENMATESIVQNFNLLEDQYDSSLPLEVNVKGQIFDIMQKQGFVLRHFGVTTADQIESVENVLVSSDGTKRTISGKERVEKLLNEPSQRRSYLERKLLGNDQIGYSSGRVLAILGISVIFLIHRVLMGLLIGSASLLLLGIGFLKEITIATSVYALVFMLFKKDKRLAFNWFFGRMKWMLAFILSSLIFNMFLSFIVLLINGISAQKASLLIILPFDIILCLAIYYLVTHAPQIWEKLMADFDIDGNSGIINLAKGVIGGDITPLEMFNKFKNRNDETPSSDNISNPLNHKSLTNMTKDNDELSESESGIEESNEDLNTVDDEATESTLNKKTTESELSNQVNTSTDAPTSINTEETEGEEAEQSTIDNYDDHLTNIETLDDDVETDDNSDDNNNAETLDNSKIPEDVEENGVDDDLIDIKLDDPVDDSTDDQQGHIKSTDEDLSEKQIESDTVIDSNDENSHKAFNKEKDDGIQDKNNRGIERKVDSNLADEVALEKDDIIEDKKVSDESLNEEEFHDMDLAIEKEREEEKTKSMDDFMESLDE